MMAAATPWDALLRCSRPTAQFNRGAEPATPRPKTKVARVRELLRQNGEMSAASICMEVEYPNTGLLALSLKHDIAMGRFIFSDGLYSVNLGYDADLHLKIKRAKALLCRHGYTVVRPWL